MNPLVIMLIGGIISFLLGALICVLIAFGEFVLGLAHIAARSCHTPSSGVRVSKVVGWMLLLGGGISVTISIIGYILKWLHLV